MPHAWWHRPEIWEDYAAPALGAAVQAPVIKQTLEGIEALHRRGVVPAVSRALEPLPFRWEETAPGVPKGGEDAWWDPFVRDRLQQGRLVGNFDQYLTPEGNISPGGVLRQLTSASPIGWAQAIAEENLPIQPVTPNTLQQQNIMEEARARGIGPFRQDPFADFTPSGRQQREIREDLYKLPPYTRGIAEELPYLAIPPARIIRGGLQGVRTGAALADAGRLGRMAPAARGTIRGTEMALKPVEVLEQGLARAVAAPFRAGAAGFRALQPTPQIPLEQRLASYTSDVGGAAAEGPIRRADEALVRDYPEVYGTPPEPTPAQAATTTTLEQGVPRVERQAAAAEVTRLHNEVEEILVSANRAAEAERAAGGQPGLNPQTQTDIMMGPPAYKDDIPLIMRKILNQEELSTDEIQLWNRYGSQFTEQFDTSYPTPILDRRKQQVDILQDILNRRTEVPQPTPVQAVPEPSVAAVDNQPVIRGKTTGYQSQLGQDIISIPDSAYPANRGFGVQRIAEVFRNARNMTRNQRGENLEGIGDLPFEMQGAYGQRTSFEMMAEVRDAVLKVYEEDGRFLNNNNFNRVIRDVNRKINSGEFEGTFDDMLEDFLVELSTVTGRGGSDGLRSGTSRQQFLDELRKPVEPSAAQAVPEPPVVAAAPTAPAVPEPVDVQVGISAAVLPEQRGKGYTEFFTDDDYYNWQQAKGVLERPPTPLSLETALRVPEIQAAQNMIDQLSIAGRDRVQKTLSDAGFEGTVDTNSGLFGGEVEPSLVIRATVPADQLDDFTRTVVDIADTDFNQKNVIVHTVEPSTGNTFGRTVNSETLGETLEPAVSVRFTRELSQAEIQRYGARYVELEKEIGLSGFGGFATHADRQGLDMLNLTVYNDDYTKHIDTVKRFLKELQNDGLGIRQTPERSTRRVRTIGDRGDGIVTYADYRSYHDAQKLPAGTAADTTTGTTFEPTQLAVEAARTPDIPLQEMSVQSYRERFADVINSPIEAINNAVLREPFKRALKKAVGIRNLSGRGTASVYRKLIGNRFPEFNGADALLNFRKDWFSYNIRTQIADSFDARGVNSAPALDISRTSVGPSRAEILHRSINSSDTRAATRIQNLYKNHAEPAIQKGVVLDDVERYAQVMFWRQIKERFKTLKKKERLNPQVWDADTGVYKDVSDADLLNWGSREWLQKNKGYTSEQLDVLESTATSLKDLYAELRTRLLNEGILTRERYDEWVRVYSWYNPIDYVEFIDKGMDIGRRLGGRFNVVDDGVYALSENTNIKMGAQSVFGETLWQHVARGEARIARNKSTRIAVDVYKNTRQLKDVTDKFETVLKDGTKRLKNVDDFYGKTVAGKPSVDAPDSGYFSYYENGERKVFAASDGGPIHKDIWDDVMGRTGMAMDSPSQLNVKLAATNGWFRSVYTTYNPLFWVRNMVIDMFTAQLKAGVSPLYTGRKVIEGLYNVSRNKEDKFVEMMRSMDGWGETSGYVESRIINDVRRELINADQVNSAVIVTSSKQLDKLLRRSVLDRIKDTTIRIGGVVEAAPRYAAAEKTLHKTIGKKELNRIKNLPEEKHMKTMLDDWVPESRIDETTGKVIDIPDADRRSMGPFVDTPQSQAAAENSFMSTLDFSYGGAQIKKLNDYFLFLKATTEGAKIPFRALGIDLFPVTRPIQNPTRHGPHWEFGSASEQLKHYATLGIKDRPFQGRTLDIISGGPTGAAMRIGAVITAYLAIQEYWNKSFTYQGTPLYYDIPQYVRYNSLIFMLPPERDDSGELVLDPATDRPKPKYLLIPHRLREWNSIFQAFIFLSEETDEDEAVANDKRRWATEVFKSTSPIAELPMPEIFTLASEQLTGYDMWRESPIVPEELQEGPLEEQYTRQTSKSIRAASGVVDELDILPDFMQEYIGSPSRLEHLYESILGGVGTMSLNMADFAGELMEEMRGVEARPMEEKVADYREMNRLERAEFRASLSESEYRQFEKEIREPEKEVPFWSALERSFYPQRGGGLRQAGQQAALSENPEISQKDTRNAGIAASKVRRELLTEQQNNDSFLDNWRNKDKTKGALSPKEWREAKSDKWKKYEGAQIAIGKIYKNAAQSADPNVKDKYYADIYTAAGTMQDTRVGVDFLLAGYYAIEPTEDSPTDVNWDEFFSERNEYIASIQSKSEVAGDGLFEVFLRSLEANDTPTEKAYDSARELLAPYWNTGKNLSELTSNPSPQLQQIWDEYLNADRGGQRQMQDSIPYLNTLIELRSIKRKNLLKSDADAGGGLDEALVFWYGDFHQGVTLRGQQYHDQLYGKTSTGFIPRPSEAIPVRTR